MSSEAAKLKCSVCKEDRDKKHFTTSQQKRKSKRKCKDCTKDGVMKAGEQDANAYYASFKQSKEIDEEYTNEWQEFKKLVAEANIPTTDLYKTDEALARFFVARKFDPAAAFKQYKNTLEFRKEMKLDEIVDNPPTKIINTIRGIHPECSAGYDKAGCLVVYWRAGRIHGQEVSRRLSEEQYNLYHCWTMENWIAQARKVKQEMKRVDMGESMTVITDCAGLGLHVRHFLNFFKNTSEIDEKFYPETLGNVFIVNVPSIFTVIFNIVKPWLDPNTVEKIHVLKQSEQKDVLLAHISEDQLLEEYGGKLRAPPEYDWKEYSADELEAFRKDNERDTKTYLVPARSSYTEEVVVTDEMLKSRKPSAKDGAVRVVVEYLFHSVGNDIKFGVEFFPEGKGEEEKASRTLIKETKCRSHKHDIWGELAVDRAGKLVFKWNNEYSIFTRKTINYSLRIVSGDISVIQSPSALQKQADLDSDDDDK